MKIIFFKKIGVSVAFCLVLAFGFSGCVPVMIASVAAVGGYAVSPDTVEGSLSRSFSEAWDAAYDIMSIMGKTYSQNQNTGEIISFINGTRVTVVITSNNASSCKLSVKARKSFMPKMDVAQDVYTKIVNRTQQ